MKKRKVSGWLILISVLLIIFVLSFATTQFVLSTSDAELRLSPEFQVGDIPSSQIGGNLKTSSGTPLPKPTYQCGPFCGDGIRDCGEDDECNNEDDVEDCDDGRHCEDGTRCVGSLDCFIDGDTNNPIGDGECKTRDGDGCSAECEDEICGNEIVAYSDPDGDGDYTVEECDDGKQCSDGQSCSTDEDCVGIGDQLCKTRDGDGCSAVCENELQACCFSNDNSCNELAPSDCTAAGGIPLGPESGCTPGVCGCPEDWGPPPDFIRVVGGTQFTINGYPSNYCFWKEPPHDTIVWNSNHWYGILQTIDSCSYPGTGESGATACETWVTCRDSDDGYENTVWVAGLYCGAGTGGPVVGSCTGIQINMIRDFSEGLFGEYELESAVGPACFDSSNSFIDFSLIDY
jgi:hypothetical protein